MSNAIIAALFYHSIWKYQINEDALHHSVIVSESENNQNALSTVLLIDVVRMATAKIEWNYFHAPKTVALQFPPIGTDLSIHSNAEQTDKLIRRLKKIMHTISE